MKLNLLLIFCVIFLNLNAQKTPQQTVEAFFTAFEKADTATLITLVSKDLHLKSISIKSEITVNESNLSELLSSLPNVKSLYPNYKEEILEFKIQENEHLATVWTPYIFYLDKTKNQISHCGDNSFQLIKLEKNWVIHSIYDTRMACDKLKEIK